MSNRIWGDRESQIDDEFRREHRIKNSLGYNVPFYIDDLVDKLNMEIQRSKRSHLEDCPYRKNKISIMKTKYQEFADIVASKVFEEFGTYNVEEDTLNEFFSSFHKDDVVTTSVCLFKALYSNAGM